MLRVDAIDESHVTAGEGPCHGRIKLRTTHNDLPGSRLTMYLRKCAPTLADFSRLDTTNFPQMEARHMLTQ